MQLCNSTICMLFIYHHETINDTLFPVIKKTKHKYSQMSLSPPSTVTPTVNHNPPELPLNAQRAPEGAVRLTRYKSDLFGKDCDVLVE